MEVLDKVKTIIKEYDGEIEIVIKERNRLHYQEMGKGNGFEVVNDIEILDRYIEALEKMKKQKVEAALEFEADWICE